MISLGLDILLAILLMVTIWYSTILNRRLNALREDKTELDELTSSFSDATLRAGDSIVQLKNTADDLKERIDNAGSLRDDLMFLVERGGAMADRLEQSVRAARVQAEETSGAKVEELIPAVRKRTMAKGQASTAATGGRSEAERDLLRALQSAR
jgi:hypothetical protein